MTQNGIVTRGHGNRFVVYSEGEYFDCQLRGRVKYLSDRSTPVAVGDDVTIKITEKNCGVIESVKKRKSVLSRPAVGREDNEHVLAANIDFLVIVTSIAQPTLKTGLIDRFLIAARIGQLTPVIVVNKVDLKRDDYIEDIVKTYQGLNYDLFMTSALDTTGLREFREYLRDHRSILAGHSGVGKSSLLNCLLPNLNLRIKTISKVTGKGRHATSYNELFHLPEGGFVIDSPGIKVLGLWQLERETLAGYYPEMAEHMNQCRFTACCHIHEPDCAVKNALKAGKIASFRYQNYVQIYQSL